MLSWGVLCVYFLPLGIVCIRLFSFHRIFTKKGRKGSDILGVSELANERRVYPGDGWDDA
jgi:hypothetical protein